MNIYHKPYQSAAVLVIGNEVLSGRTREANAYLAAQKLFQQGCRLGEVAIVADIQDDIIQSLNRLRQQYDVVITSGGIGPTHDDITMQSIAKAFDVALLEHEETIQKLHDYYGDDLNAGRRRMARLPQGASPIICEASFMPGAHISNVYVLAGVPDIFASQLNSFIHHFGGTPFIRQEIEVKLAESLFAQALSQIQQQFSQVEIGSYPQRCGSHAQGKICFSSQDNKALQQAKQAVQDMLQNIKH